MCKQVGRHTFGRYDLAVLFSAMESALDCVVRGFVTLRTCVRWVESRTTLYLIG